MRVLESATEHARRVTALEHYLDSRFRGAFIRSIPSRSDQCDVAHIFIVETDDHRFALVVLRRFLTEFQGNLKRYLVKNDVWKAMRSAEPACVLVAPQGLAPTSYGPDDWAAAFGPP